MARARALLERLGFAGGPGDTRLAWRLVLALLLLYTLSFAFFYPRVATNSDEAQFIQQTRLLLEGTVTASVTDPFTDRTFESWAATFPVGTAALMTPFIAAFGWRGAFLVPCLGLVLGVTLSARWLQQEGHSPC